MPAIERCTLTRDTITLMDIAIIGGGFTGLAAAYYLAKKGHTVTVFEKEAYLGGLAHGFKEKSWDWHIEAAYHHLFTNDRHILALIHELGLQDKLIIKRPITATLWKGAMYQLDSPKHLFLFPGLSLIDKIRTACLLAFFKFFPLWKTLEHVTAERFLTSVGGKNTWKILWEPLLYGKFGTYAPLVAASWFWARIVKRTPSLCYIAGGFHTLVIALEKAIVSHNGAVVTSTAVQSVTKAANDTLLVTYNDTKQPFDRVLITVPTLLAANIAPIIPASYLRALNTVPHVSAQTLIIETDRPILKNVYWLNVTDRSFPFLAAVAHANFMDPKHYGGRHLTYFGNYLPPNHPYLSMTKGQLLKEFMPFIKRLHVPVNSKLSIVNSYMFVGPYAKPVHEIRYSEKIPSIQTPVPHLYLANMDFVVPWDRGTNYAVELGQKAAKIIHENRYS